jgi:hypothetical protein
LRLIFGERVIKDKKGRKIGTIRKNFWGDTVIDKKNNEE